jgi:hypothetical protein
MRRFLFSFVWHVFWSTYKQMSQFVCRAVEIAVRWTWPVKAGRIGEELDQLKGDHDRQQGLFAIMGMYITEPHDANSVNIDLSRGQMLWFLSSQIRECLLSKLAFYSIRFDIFMVVIIQIETFWVVAVYSCSSCWCPRCLDSEYQNLNFVRRVHHCYSE